MNRALALLQKVVDVRPNEVRTLGLGFAFHFLILTGYYILRPIRDSIAASNRLETLPWMFTATLVAMLLANVLFAAVVARMSRRKFIPLAYGFFIFNLGLFFVLMRSSPPEEQIWIGRGLYVWVSVFNLFNTAIFWAFMTDLFTVEQGKRLYGFIAVGGSLGAIAGAYITKHYVGQIGPANLLAISAVMFAVAGSLVRFFPTGFADRHTPDEANAGGGHPLSPHAGDPKAGSQRGQRAGQRGSVQIPGGLAGHQQNVNRRAAAPRPRQRSSPPGPLPPRRARGRAEARAPPRAPAGWNQQGQGGWRSVRSQADTYAPSN
jgi:AAA family ATP:ADP antiporter